MLNCLHCMAIQRLSHLMSLPIIGTYSGKFLKDLFSKISKIANNFENILFEFL